jgi:hypothetical protein
MEAIEEMDFKEEDEEEDFLRVVTEEEATEYQINHFHFR